MILATYIAVVVTFVIIAKNEKIFLIGSNDQPQSQVTNAIIKVINPEKDVDALSKQIKVIFRSHDRKAKGLLTEYGLVSLLEDTFTSLSSEKADSPKLDLLMKLINKEKEKDPYYGLKFEQKVIIKNLESKVPEAKIQGSFIEQIKEVVRRQNTEIDELKKSNSWGIPVGIAGVILTLLFGVLSLLYPALSKNKG
tara:strand:- start:635 stop:1219 length:585 start_codon:yes stop_codon:yes gene_type:complete